MGHPIRDFGGCFGGSKLWRLQALEAPNFGGCRRWCVCVVASCKLNLLHETTRLLLVLALAVFPFGCRRCLRVLIAWGRAGGCRKSPNLQISKCHDLCAVGLMMRF